jgi:hypothetical protein
MPLRRHCSPQCGIAAPRAFEGIDQHFLSALQETFVGSTISSASLRSVTVSVSSPTRVDRQQPLQLGRSIASAAPPLLQVAAA